MRSFGTTLQHAMSLWVFKIALNDFAANMVEPVPMWAPPYLYTPFGKKSYNRRLILPPNYYTIPDFTSTHLLTFKYCSASL